MSFGATAEAGHGGSAFAVGGDHVAGDQYVENVYSDDYGFSPLRLEDSWLARVKTPGTVDEICFALLQRRLAVLGGSLLRDKPALGRHVAWRILHPDGGAVPSIRQVRQRRCGLADPPLDLALDAAEEPTLFVLWDAEPRHLEHDLRRVLDWIERGPHSLLVTTDSPRGGFGLSDESPVRHAWWPLATHQVYDAEYRTELLLASLDLRADGSVRALLFPDGRPSSSKDRSRPLVKDLSVGDVISEIETPEQIVLLARFLADPPAILDAESVGQEIDRIAGDSSAVEGWFRRLAPRQQLFVSGIVFFDGLFDDQMFSALDLAVESAWRPRQPTLECFDYQDLDDLERYVRFPRSMVSGQAVECRSGRLRQALLRAAWQYRRRHLMVVLPLVAELIGRAGDVDRARRGRGGVFVHPEALPERSSEDTAAEEDPGSDPDEVQAEGLAIGRSLPYGPERELLGLAPRRRRLYAVARRSLGDLGRLSPHAVERCLYEIASHGSWEAQTVAAQALWSWRGTDREGRMFRMLKEWHGAGARTGRNAGAAATPTDNVHSTVVWTLFYAALDDPPDELHAEAVLLLERLADERARQHHPEVRARLRWRTLPVAVKWHRGQLDPVLQRLVADPELIEPIAVGWSWALASRPAAALPPLVSWPQPLAGAQALLGPFDPARPFRLAAVALTYQRVDYDDPRIPLSPADAAGAVTGLLADPEPFVRWYVLRALESLVVRHFEDTEGPLKDAAWRIGLEERGAVLRPLVRLARPPAGSSGPAPSSVEARLESWLGDELRPVAQQIALEALTAIAAVDVGEEPARFPTGRNSGASGQTETLRGTGWIGRAILDLATIGRGEHRAACAAPVAELIHQLDGLPRATDHLLSGWRGRSDSLGAMTGTLRTVATWYRRRHALGVVLAVIALLAIVALSLEMAGGGGG
jgi:hypothetical protein